jgi:hypothetical protein
MYKNIRLVKTHYAITKYIKHLLSNTQTQVCHINTSTWLTRLKNKPIANDKKFIYVFRNVDLRICLVAL